MNLKAIIINIVILAIFLLSIESAIGVPSNPTPFILTQPDGSSFTARYVGDENEAYFETIEGYTILKNENKEWEYAGKDEIGKLIPNGLKVGIEKPQLAKHLREDKPKIELISDITSEPSRITQPEFASQIGDKKVLTILIGFTDVSPNANHTSTYYQNLLFNKSLDANSMYNYYNEVSYGKLNITGDISGNKWYNSSYAMSYYGKDGSGTDDYYGRSYRLICEAISLANPDIDYTQYDEDKNGYIDHIIIVHAGNGQESSYNSDDIWSVRWSGGLCGSTTFDGKKVNRGTIQAETSPLGTFAHEFGHDLGLPDLYDRDGSSNGVGSWDIMASGSWLNSGNTPAHFSAWSKYFLGWVTPKKVISLLNQKINQSEFDDDVYMLLDNPNGISDWNRDGTGIGEYFLVENRRKIGYDAYLPGEGLLIWHIDESKGNNDDENHKLVDLEEADGLAHLDKKTNRGDSGDSWKNSVNGFGDYSNPNSKFYNGTSSGVRVTNISDSSSEMTANLMPPPLINFVYPTPVNNSVQTFNWIFVNITSDVSLVSPKLEWNGTNENMTDLWINKTGLSDGKYNFRVFGNDIANNWNFTETRIVTIDTIKPSVSSNKIITKTGNEITFNVTIFDVGSDVKNASIDVSNINNTFENIMLNYINDTWISSVVVNISDGVYYLNITAYDNAGNVNNTEKITVIVDNIPPSSVSNLYSTSYGSTYINWTWIDPNELDFSHVIVYIDGNFTDNVSKGVQFYNVTRLNPDTWYEIAIQSVDVLGNINITLINNTSKTSKGNILSYYRSLGNNINVVETEDLLKAADDWSADIVPFGYTSAIATWELLQLADEWKGS